MRRAALVLALLLFTAPGWAADSVRKVVDDGNKTFLAAYARGDAAAIGALYSEGAMIMPAGGKLAQGRAAAQEFWQGMIQAGVKNITLQTVSVEPHGRIAREIGQFAMDLPNLQQQLTRVEGKYVVIWKKLGGKWFMDVDIWNTDH